LDELRAGLDWKSKAWIAIGPEVRQSVRHAVGAR
jgi:hypothetical protein